uniref:Uncharacterized protein n=1 Tax=Kalanchoe fedtschenkoi TaxID=63787 RepID=A0A7N0US10_KALFE
MAPFIAIDFTGQKGSENCSVAPMMGKARKVSKGLTSGFVPDYRHSVETVGESEGFGSSVRVENEMTASGDSLPIKRKYENYDKYGVPVQVVSMSTISRSKKKDLKTRLKKELELLRSFEREVSSSSNVVFSPSSETRSCSDGKKRPTINSYQGPSAVSNIQRGRKLAPPRKGPGLKQCQSGKIQTGRSAASLSTPIDTLLKQCLTLLDRLMSHQYGWVFNDPVDAEKLNIPDYHTVIKHPMDLGTVKRRLTGGDYSNLLNFANDVRLTFSNAMSYNPRGTDVHVMAETLSKIFETRWKQIAKKLNSSASMQSMPSRVGSSFGTGNGAPVHDINKNEASSTDSKIKLDSVRQTMTDKEKQSLITELEALLGELPDKIVNFLKEQSSTAGQTCEDEIEIDLEALDDDTLFQLRKLIDEYKQEKHKIYLEAGPCEIELVREPGISNSSILANKGDNQAEMDVDVGENDISLVNYPPVEIDKDAAHKESKLNSSSTSSSDSGSSSSDSGSSSDHESDGPEVSASASNVKVSLADPGENIDKSNVKNDGTNTPQLDENDSHNKLPHMNAETHQEEENAPSERPVSPDKLYRAALLRSRFADTILKAREKTLEQGEDQDPEKLRIEREQLERQLKAEKARLQADAKAAEEARKKADAEVAAEAAAEARRKRELEREAAREALLKMEKTVEINENSKFMEDLEMLRAAAAEEVVIPSTSAEERIPDQSQSLEQLGSFNFQGNSNPLEQLGLYMKVDEEEEEEEEASGGRPD